MLAFCFQTKEAQGNIVGDTLVSETSVSSHTGQTFPSWSGVSGGSPSEVPVPGLHGPVCRHLFWWWGWLAGRPTDRASLFPNLPLAGPAVEHCNG